MTLYVPSAIFTDSESVADQYGPYWNACSKDNGTWTYISYIGYNEE
jgi:hypothetical protein